MSQRIGEDAIGPGWEWVDFGNGHGMVQWRGGNGEQELSLAGWLRRQRLRVVADCRASSGRAGIVFVADGGEAQEAIEYR